MVYFGNVIFLFNCVVVYFVVKDYEFVKVDVEVVVVIELIYIKVWFCFGFVCFVFGDVKGFMEVY